MEDPIVFRSQFVLAWPIWAGGYPTQPEAFNVIRKHRDEIISSLVQSLQDLLGTDFFLSDFQYQIGTHVPISGLFPNRYSPNSLNLIIVIRAPYASLGHARNLSSKVSEVVEDLAGLIKTFAQIHMPDALNGANLYDVTGSWDPGSGMSFAESGEPLQKVSIPSQARESPSSAQNETKRSRVFISYSHRDSKWLTRLQVHLMPLARDFGIDLWDDTKIKSGMKWRDAIANAIGDARVAILLVSADFMASDFIAKNELPPLLSAARNEGTLILPVILSPSMFLHTPELSQYQAVNDPSTPLVSLSKGKQEKVLNAIAVAVRAHFLGV